MNTERTPQVPLEVYDKAIKLHEFLANNLKVELPHARAAGMIYFHKYYKKRQSEPRRYGLMAISSLYLACKVCESPRQLKDFIRIIEELLRKSSFPNIFQSLDGIPSVSDPNFDDTFTQLLISSEMELLKALKFQFEVSLPYNTAENFLKRILLWHIPSNAETFQLLYREMHQICWNLLDKLLLAPAFYVHEPNLIALSIINVLFLYCRVTLSSPQTINLNSFLAPQYSDLEFERVKKEVDDFFVKKWKEEQQPFTICLRTTVNMKQMTEWLNYPLERKLREGRQEPICPPPPLWMVDQIFENDKSFTKMDSDHAPPVPPPSIAPAEELLIMQKDIESLKQKERDIPIEKMRNGPEIRYMSESRPKLIIRDCRSH